MKPLPLIGNCLFIDNSMLEVFSSCPRASEYSFLEKRIIASNKTALNFGTAIHKALETRYLIAKAAKPTDELFNLQTKAIEQSLIENPTAEDDHRNLNWCVDIIKKYNEIYHTEPFNLLIDKDGKALVELPFALPLFEWSGFVEVPPDATGLQPIHQTIKVIYTGKIDLPCEWNSEIWIIDNKTASSLGDRYFKGAGMSAQLHGYCWAFEELTKRKVSGFCVNAIRTSAIPVKPKNGIDAWWRETLQRQRFYSTPEDRVEWKANAIAMVKTFLYYYQQSYFPKHNFYLDGHGIRCGNCQYYGVCSYPQDKRQMILNSNEYTDNKWSPLKQNKNENNNDTKNTIN